MRAEIEKHAPGSSGPEERIERRARSAAEVCGLRLYVRAQAVQSQVFEFACGFGIHSTAHCIVVQAAYFSRDSCAGLNDFV